MITQNELKEALYYDAETGVFTWKTITTIACRYKIGDIAGSLNNKGYIVIGINNKVMKGHRLAHLYEYGIMPKEVDHINGIKHDNRISNLRDVSSAGNSQNRRKAKVNNSTGYLGVGKHGNQFIATITVNYKRYNLGCYDSPELAHDVYIDMKRKLHATCTI
jgi:hypothetical protein